MINVIFNDINTEIMPKQLEQFEKYCKVLQWGRRHPTRFVEQFFNMQLTDMQKWIFLSSWVPRFNVWLLSRNSGKALSLDTKVYCNEKVYNEKNNCYEYKDVVKTIGELRVGDKIYDDTNKLTEVIHLNPVVFDDEFDIYFEGGEVIKCNQDHLWFIYDKKLNEYFVIDTRTIFWFLNNPSQDKEFLIPTIDKKFKKIVSVEHKLYKIPMRCITVNNKDGLFLCGEKKTITHNSYLASIFLMARALLLPHTNSYIMAPSGGQAQETFTKLENIAKNNIASAVGISSVFIDETMRMNSKADPFTHDNKSYSVSLYNGSTINTLNSVAKNIVGIRLIQVVLRFIGFFKNLKIINGQNR